MCEYIRKKINNSSENIEAVRIINIGKIAHILRFREIINKKLQTHTHTTRIYT